MKALTRYLYTAALGLLLIISAGACSASGSGKIKVMTSTSLMANIVQAVGGDKVEVTNLIPGTNHPGDFNVKPGDIEKLATAKIFFLHGWPGEGFADKMIASANNPNLVVVKANVNGNWMVPSVHAEATDKIAGELIKNDAANASLYREAADKYKKAVKAEETKLKSRLMQAGVSTVNVIASGMQADFLKWAGLNVVATYSDPKSLTPQIVKELIDKGKSSGVTLIVDNLQNGKDAGKAVAEDLKAKQINLSNFPGGFDNTETWQKAIEYNVNLLIKAASK